ncbi:MAG: phage major tail tube protein [Hydrogenophaga sp.]|uniref:phage major tail tube protein n=1 Tax=Hydrogenophaga sp. TaxID=1904254 RepID=UPI002720C933|nr:phage major tail tube protein [Hydrogenophaga sp.]MDO9571170.1 phage major tail tube protein [Hydrogenophaga sp.]
MALPKKLKNFNLFVNGLSYAGLVPEVTLPKLTRKTEDYQAGGMQGPVKQALGMEGLEMQWTMGGFDRETLAQWGVTTVAGLLLRFAGALQQDDTGAITALEVVVRGYHTEMDPGTAKAGDKTEIKITSALSYYKVSMNGVTVIEIDMVNSVYVVNGKDLAAAERLALGL